MSSYMYNIFLKWFHCSYLSNDTKFACLRSLQHTSFCIQNRSRWWVSPIHRVRKKGATLVFISNFAYC